MNVTGTLVYVLLLILTKGFCRGVMITQWPVGISSFINTSVDMHCYQNDTDYDYTYWYRQIRGKAPVLIVRSVAGSVVQEKGFELGFKAWGTKKKWSLTVDVKEDSAAVFLCAARSHSVRKLITRGPKTCCKSDSAHRELKHMHVNVSGVSVTHPVL
ncbi:T-cell receptor beta, type 1 [Clarias magur]|nr:T-cell receptor beta, type 1 [Clarias magur]